MTHLEVPGQFQGTVKRLRSGVVVPQLLEWSSSLAYKITQLGKTKHTTFHGRCSPLCDGPHTLRVCLSLNPNKSTSYLLLCLSLNFCNKTSKAWASLGLKSGTEGFGHAQVLGERRWRMGGKSSGKKMPRNPLPNLPENVLNTWPVLTVFIGLIVGTKKIKDRRTPTFLVNSY